MKLNRFMSLHAFNNLSQSGEKQKKPIQANSKEANSNYPLSETNEPASCPRAPC